MKQIKIESNVPEFPGYILLSYPISYDQYLEYRLHQSNAIDLTAEEKFVEAEAEFWRSIFVLCDEVSIEGMTPNTPTPIPRIPVQRLLNQFLQEIYKEINGSLPDEKEKKS